MIARGSAPSLIKLNGLFIEYRSMGSRPYFSKQLATYARAPAFQSTHAGISRFISASKSALVSIVSSALYRSFVGYLQKLPPVMRAGTPIAVTSYGISRTTTDPAPTIERLPIRTPGTTHEPAPKKDSQPISTFPANALPGPTWAPLPIRQSWSTPALVLTITPSPISTEALMIAPAMTAIPRPRVAEGEIIASGLMVLMISKPISAT